MTCKGDLEPKKMDVDEYAIILEEYDYKAEPTGTCRLRKDSHSDEMMQRYQEYCDANDLLFHVEVVKGPKHNSGSEWYEVHVSQDSPFRYVITDKSGEPIGIAVATQDANGNLLGNFIHDDADSNERIHEYLHKYHHIITGKASGKTNAKRIVSGLQRDLGPENVKVTGTISDPSKPNYEVEITINQDAFPPIENEDDILKDLGIL